MSELNNRLTHLFHWPSFPEYQESLLQIIALPKGAKGQLDYDRKWVNDSFQHIISTINRGNRIDGILWTIGCSQPSVEGRLITRFEFSCPIRKITIIYVDERDNRLDIDYIVQEYVNELSRFTADRLNEFTQINFDENETPLPGNEKGHVHVAPKIDINLSENLELSSIHSILEDIPCSKNYKEGINIWSFPLIKNLKIEKSKLTADGRYKLLKDKAYKISFQLYQSEDLRDRRVFINGIKFRGKDFPGNIIIEETRKSVDRIDIKIDCDKIDFEIPIEVNVKTPFLRKQFTTVSILFGISICAILGFFHFFPDSQFDVKAGLGVALLVVFFERLIEALSK